MGILTDTLRSTLRDLAKSDARLYRGLAEELDGCTVAELRRMARARGLTALARKGRRDDLISVLSSPGA